MAARRGIGQQLCAVAVGVALVSACQAAGVRVSSVSSATTTAWSVPSGPGTGDLFVTGVVRRDGHPLGDASVFVNLMADDGVPVGAKVPTWQSPNVISGPDGRFAIRLQPADIPVKFLPPDSEFLNFELSVISGLELASWNWTVYPLDDKGTWRTEGASATGSVAQLDFSFGSRPTITVTDSDGQRERSPLLVIQFRH